MGQFIRRYRDGTPLQNDCKPLGKWISYVELTSLSIQRPRHATCQLTFDPADRQSSCQRHFRSSGPGNRVASNTFDPAAPAIELPATLSTQRPRQSSCQRHFRSSGPGNRVASGTFDPAAPAIELPAALSIQRLRQPELPANKKRRSLTSNSRLLTSDYY